MARGVNRVFLVGHLGRDPEIRVSKNGTAIANLSIATTESRSDDGEQRQERTEWHRVIAFGKLADIAKAYATKGRQCYVEGSLRTRSWEDESGAKRSTVEVIATSLLMLGSRDEGRPGESRSGEGEARGGRSAPSAPQGREPFQATDEDVPF